jgi:hypothetical protein
LTISLPYKTLQHQKIKLDTDFKEVIDTITYIGQITLFDNAGEILKINNKEKFLIQFWCENDGGIQYRPTLKTKVKKTEFRRPLKAINKIQNICCFALVNRSGQIFESTNLTTDKTVEMKGDYNGDGKIDCFIWTVLDEAMNCDEKPDNNLEIMLRVGKNDYRLRCCGP